MFLTLDSIRDIKLYQRERGYRFSLDALLLFDFVRLKTQKKAVRVVDLGAGSGVIGLLLARKYGCANIWLIELQESLFSLACRNISLNRLGDRVCAVRADINSISEGPSFFSKDPDKRVHGAGIERESFDVAVSNPPFRKVLSGRICPDQEKAMARHELKLPLPALVRAAGNILKEKGRFFMVYHPERLLEALEQLRMGGFEPKRLRFVHGREGLPAKVMLIESVKGGSPGLSVEDPLFVYDEEGGYTSGVRRIYEV